MTSSPSQIVIIGAGFAGLWSALGAARKLDLEGKSDGSVEIILIAPEPTLYIRPRLYENDVGGASAPLGELLASVGVRFIQGVVERILINDSRVEYRSSGEPGASLSQVRFDRLVLASGSKLFRPAAVSGIAEYTHNADQMDDARRLDEHIKSLAALPDSPARNTVVVCGGGFTGIEIAAEMPERLRGVLGKGVDVEVVVLERGDAIGTTLGAGPRPIVQKAFGELGVKVLTGESVIAVDANGVAMASGKRILSKTVIWTVGMRASDLTEQIPGERDALGRLQVTRDLKVIGLERVFAAGDTARALTDDEGHYSLMSCQHAIPLGKAAGNNVVADLLGLPMEKYSQKAYVTCLALGPWGAVFTNGWERSVLYEGAAANSLKKSINTQMIYPPPAVKADALAAAESQDFDFPPPV